MISSLHSELQPLLNSFRNKSRQVLEDILHRLDELPHLVRHEAEGALRNALRSIPALVQALEACPIGPQAQELGGRRRDMESLLEALCREEWLPLDFTVPTGATVGRALVVARINFLKSLCYCLLPCASAEIQRIAQSLRELVEDAIFVKLAEELLTYVVSNHLNRYELRRAAARKLLTMWNDRGDQAVGEFPSVVLSAWKARRRVRTIYGTLFGSEELLSLIRCECEPRFLDFFLREQVTVVQTQAFREFLFGLPHEDLQRIEAYMRERALHVVSQDQVQEILGRPVRYFSPIEAEPTAEEVFASYYRRRIRTEYRVLSGSPGPNKTAEGYLMEALLSDEIERVRPIE